MIKIAEVWSSTQAEVELEDDHWLRGDDTYHCLSRRRAARGHQSLVCLMTDRGRKSAWRDGVRYEFFPADPIPAYQPGPRSEEMLIFLEAWRPEVLLLHSANRLQTLLCLQRRFPGTHCVLDSNSAATEGRVLDEIVRHPDLVSACIFKARVIRDCFCKHTGYPRERTRVFPSGIDVETFKPVSVDPDRDCVWVGYLRENNLRKKNVSMLMEVFEGLESELHVVGRGKMASTLCQIAPHNVKFLGFTERRKLPALLSRYKVFLQPSLFDPCPRAVSEALACGLAVVGLKVGLGTEDQILDAVNGYRVSSPAEMRHAIQKLLTSEGLRRQMGLASRRIAETHFDIERLDWALEEFLKDVIDR